MELHLYGVKRENSYGEFFTSIGLNIQHKYAWGVKDEDEIYDITFDIIWLGGERVTLKFDNKDACIIEWENLKFILKKEEP